LETLIRQIMAVSAKIAGLDQQLATWHTESEASRRLAAIPGLGIITATAICRNRYGCRAVLFGQAVRRLAWSYTATTLNLALRRTV
jgi:transposase